MARQKRHKRLGHFTYLIDSLIVYLFASQFVYFVGLSDFCYIFNDGGRLLNEEIKKLSFKGGLMPQFSMYERKQHASWAMKDSLIAQPIYCPNRRLAQTDKIR